MHNPLKSIPALNENFLFTGSVVGDLYYIGTRMAQINLFITSTVTVYVYPLAQHELKGWSGTALGCFYATIAINIVGAGFAAYAIVQELVVGKEAHSKANKLNSPEDVHSGPQLHLERVLWADGVICVILLAPMIGSAILTSRETGWHGIALVGFIFTLLNFFPFVVFALIDSNRKGFHENPVNAATLPYGNSGNMQMSRV